MKKGDLLTVEIESLAFGGEGIARVVTEQGSFVVFVEDTVPGDIVEIELGKKKRSHAFGYVRKMVQASPKRIEARCKHFGSVREGGCGGCSLQFLAYNDQLGIKEQQVRDAMIRIGGFEGEVVLPILGCKEPWYYRNKMDFSFSRTKEGVLGFGLHVKRRHHDVIELTECFLFAPYAGAFVSRVRDFFRSLDAQKVLDEETVLSSLILREGKNTGEVMVNLIVENGEVNFLSDFTAMVRDFFKNEVEVSQTHVRKLTSVYFTHIRNTKGQRKTQEETILWGEPMIHEVLQLEDGVNLSYEIHPQAFFQPNTKQAQILYGEAVKAAGLSGKETVFDLFCGTGTIGLFCASKAAKVVGIELNEQAVLNARANALRNGVKNIEFVAGDVLLKLPEVQEKPDVVILDPPRAGLHENIVQHVADFGPHTVVYVSCNPTTLARDLQLFCKAGYKLESVKPVDMFPQTYHIENVALLRKIH
jgi:23S rRNA (uracil1939-C5)-methyltransferase